MTTGPGADTVYIMNSAFLAAASFDGGSGFNFFYDLGGNTFAVPPVIINF